MEPPYRNEATFAECLKRLNTDQQLCVAVDITLEEEWIQSKTIEEWRKETKPDLNKRPCLFLIGN